MPKGNASLPALQRCHRFAARIDGACPQSIRRGAHGCEAEALSQPGALMLGCYRIDVFFCPVAPLAAGLPLRVRDLATVQRRRMLPTRVIQTLAQRAVAIRVTTANADRALTPPWFIRRSFTSPRFLILPAWFIGFGLWPAHVKTGEQEWPETLPLR